MNITNTAVMTTQMVDAAINKSWFLGTGPDPLELAPCSMMDDVGDLRGPDEPVAGLVAAAGGIDDRVDHELGQTILDHEDQHRLGQEARLENAPPILMRHSTLPTVTDGLDHGHTDMPGRLHDRLHLHHRLLLPFGHEKKASGHPNRCSEASMPQSAACRGDRTTRYYTN